MRAILTILFVVSSPLLADGPAYPLPDDPDAIVLALDYPSPWDGKGKRAPWVEIRADGRIRVRGADGMDGIVKGRIDPGIVQDVLHEVVGRQRVFEWDAKRVEAAMRKAAGPGKALLPVEDAATTVLRVRLKDRRIAVTQHAVQTATELYPAIPELRRLLAASRRLDLEASILRAGGRGAVMRVIGVADPKLQATGDDRLLLVELSSARRRRDGTVLMRFRRETARGPLDVHGELDGRGAPDARIKDQRKRYALPAKGVVLSLDYRGGYGLQRKLKDPYLSVLSDGTVLAPNVHAPGKGARGKLLDARLQDLVHFIVAEQRLMDWDQKKFGANQAKRGGAYIADASTTVIRLWLRGKEKIAKVTALTYHAERGQDVPELTRLDAVERRLKRIMNVVRIGSESRAHDLRKLANAWLMKGHAGIPALTLDDLNMAAHRADGLYVSFRRFRRGKEYTTVHVLWPPKGKPVVQIHVSPAGR